MKKVKNISARTIEAFAKNLSDAERSPRTIRKYRQCVTDMLDWLIEHASCQDRAESTAQAGKLPLLAITRQDILEYKRVLQDSKSPRTVNGYIAAMNHFFQFLKRPELRITYLKIQKPMFWDDTTALHKKEYCRLLEAAKETKNFRLHMAMQTICATGIRIGELQYITVAAVQAGSVIVNCKGKIRTIVLPPKLCACLKRYIRRNKIKSGPLFISKNGKVLDSSAICSEMKALCERACVERSKVHPHNLRHLFARTFYEQTKDVVKLASLLGHSSIETTRIYTLSPLSEEIEKIDKLELVV